MAAREQIVARGVKVSEVFRPGGPGTHFQPDGSSTRLSGPSPDHTSYRSYATSSDLDGNSSLLQELATGLPEHVEHGTGYATVYGVASALRRAAAVHGEHEQISGPDNATDPIETPRTPGGAGRLKVAAISGYPPSYRCSKSDH